MDYVLKELRTVLVASLHREVQSSLAMPVAQLDLRAILDKEATRQNMAMPSSLVKCGIS
eukprot:CAMPEP_0181309172 /NCGR_PEP_ID=MMETSP1101-20121128/11871_1 /TAXON_ID=46948 /ORGANISM="Rhodomonas abbreviata, Strain Caron Lab Isolate" /LENGTH=58 /DNA_ID=CAMNT_0023415637 /DNA_START=988 /DNA_END=1161 /DNA_ORIENTATION=+